MEIVIPLDGLEESLRPIVREEIAASGDRWLNSEDAARYLGCSPAV